MKTKASDKQSVGKKLVSILKKRYKGAVPAADQPVLETILYAICLENASYEQADAAIQNLHSDFHDLNEVRVSSISELVRAFEGAPHPELRALRVRSVLYYAFEKHFAFDLEGLRRKTLELATKQLEKIRDLSAFVRNWTLQTVLGSHVVPVDDRQTAAAVWFGLVEPGATPEQAAEALKPAVRKADVPRFCYLLRRLVSEPAALEKIGKAAATAPEGGFELADAPDRLTELLKSSRSTRKKTAARANSRTSPSRNSKSGGGSKSAGRTGAQASGRKQASRKKKTRSSATR